MILNMDYATTLAPIDVRNWRTLRIQCRPASGDPSSAVVEAKRAWTPGAEGPSVSLPVTTKLDLSGDSITEIDVTDVAYIHLVCTTAASGVSVEFQSSTRGEMVGESLILRADADAVGLRGLVAARHKAIVLASPSTTVSTGVFEMKHALSAGYNAVSFSPTASLTLDGATVTEIDTSSSGVLYAACTTAQSGLGVDLFIYLRDEVAVDMTPKDFILEAAAGRVPGYSSERKFGRNVDIDTGSTPEDIWNGGGLYTGFPTSGSAETVDVFSASANDTSAGTGARTIRMFGLDADYNEQQEDITLNGTTAVTSTKTWWRLNRATVTSTGSGATNAGEITIRHTTTTANVFAVMPAQKGQTAILAYTIPNGKIALFSQLQLIVESGSGSGAEATFEFEIRDNGGAGVERTILYGLATRDRPFVERSTFTEPIPAKVDIWVRITNVSSNNTIVSGDVQYMLVPE